MKSLEICIIWSVVATWSKSYQFPECVGEPALRSQVLARPKKSVSTGQKTIFPVNSSVLSLYISPSQLLHSQNIIFSVSEKHEPRNYFFNSNPIWFIRRWKWSITKCSNSYFSIWLVGIFSDFSWLRTQQLSRCFTRTFAPKQKCSSVRELSKF